METAKTAISQLGLLVFYPTSDENGDFCLHFTFIAQQTVKMYTLNQGRDRGMTYN